MLILFVLFNLGYFAFGHNHHCVAAWISYGFVMHAFFALSATPLLVRRCPKGLSVQRATLWMHSFAFFAIEFAVGVTFLIVHTENIVWPIVVQGTLVITYLLFQFTTIYAHRIMGPVVYNRPEPGLRAKEYVPKLKECLRLTHEPLLRRVINQCIEAIKNGPTTYLPEEHPKEEAVRRCIESLSRAIDAEAGDAAISSTAMRLLDAIIARNGATVRYHGGGKAIEIGS